MIYGNAPENLGYIDLDPLEMMFYMYLPVKMSNIHEYKIPKNLEYLQKIFDKISDSIDNSKYVYVTAKTMYVDSNFCGNRPGWHADGYGSNGDINYIWYDMNPTEFAIQDFHDIPDDDFQSMIEMEKQIDLNNITTYPCKNLLRLDESIVHRVNPVVQSGIRTFIKISVSSHKYNLRGNSHNYMFDYTWDMVHRTEHRNVDNKDFKI